MVSTTLAWRDQRLKQIRRWQNARRYASFIDEAAIQQVLLENRRPSRQAILDIIEKARDHARTGELLAPADVAALAYASDPDLWEAIFEKLGIIK